MFEPWVRLLQSRNPSDIWVPFQSSSSSFCTMAHQRGNQVVKQWSEPENICFTPFKVIWSEGKAIAIDLRKLSCFYQNDHCQCWNNYSSSLRYHDVEHYVEGQVDFNLFLRFLSWNSILSPLFLLRSEFFPSLSAADCKNRHERDLDRKSLYSYSILQLDDKESERFLDKA